MLIDDHFSRLTLDVHQAGEEPSSWEGALHRLALYLNGSGCGLFTHNLRLSTGSVYSAVGYHTGFLRNYADEYSRSNIWFHDPALFEEEGAILLGADVVADDELEASVFYREWLKPQGLHHWIGGILARASATVTILEIMRPRKGRAFGTEDVWRLARLMPHLQHALALNERLTRFRLRSEHIEHALNAVATGVMLLDERGALLHANHYAQSILEAQDGLSVRGGSLKATDPQACARLRRMVNACASGDPGAARQVGRAIALSRDHGKSSLRLRVVPVAAERPLQQGSVVVVLVVDPDRPIGFDEKAICDLYGLTRVEARLAFLIAQGRSTEEAACALSIAVNTARCYLKRIFDKTGVHRQAELVRLLLLG